MPNISTVEVNALVYNIAIYNSEASYKKMFALLFTPLFRFSFYMLKSRELAEEVASDVMFRLWQKRMELLQVENVPVYALIIARNLSLNLIKKNHSARIVPLEDNNIPYGSQFSRPEHPDQILIQAQDKAALLTLINALPTRCKLVFKLIKEEGLSYKEVAEVLNISSKTVDAHLVTAMKKLTDALKVKSSCQ